MGSVKFKGSKYMEPFVGIVRSVFESPAFTALSPHACKLLLELAGQYRGDNNGDLTVAWSVVSKRGCPLPRTCSSATSRQQPPIRSGRVTSPTSRPMRGGCT